MEAITAPRATEKRSVLPLQLHNFLLSSDSRIVEYGVCVVVLAQYLRRVYGVYWVERDHDRLGEGQGLEMVDEVVQADARILLG